MAVRPDISEGRDARRRVRLAAAAALASAVGAAAVVVAPWDDGDGRRVTAIFDAVPGLVEGGQVQRGGVVVGRVERIGLEADRPRVTLRLREGERLHRGARADLRLASLSGQLNRVVAIEDGSGPPLPDGATLGRASTDQPVEVETVLATLDPATRRAVRSVLAGADRATAERGPAIAASLRRADGALRATTDVLGDVTADGVALRQVVRSTRQVSGALAAAPGTTGAAVDRLATVLSDTAAEQEALRAALDGLPSGLRAPRATLERLARQLPRLRRTTRDALPAVRALRAIAPDARAALAGSRPLLREARRLTTGAPADLAALRPLLDDALPLLRDLRPTLRQANPILDETRVRVPDFFSFFSNWADFTSNYDANGHGARVGIVLPPAPNRVASPDGQDAGNLARPFLRSPGSLQDEPWRDYRSSFVGTPAASASGAGAATAAGATATRSRGRTRR